MKSTVLLALVEHWEKEVKSDKVRNGAESAAVQNAVLDGVNEGIIRCAGDLKTLVSILGD